MTEKVVSSMQVSNSTPLQTPGRTAARTRWAKLAVVAVLVIVLAALPTFLDSPYHLHLLILCFVYIVASVSARTITISGQFPLAHAAFMGVGAYVAGLTSFKLGWPVWFTIPAGAVTAGIAGILFGYPFSRLRAFYYAMGSLFFGAAVLNIITALSDITGGTYGFSGVQPLFTVASKVPYYYVFFGLCLISCLILWRFEFSLTGINLKAIAQSHLVASSVGINESRYRIMAVGVGCFFVGLTGALFAHYNLSVTPNSYNLTATLWLVMYVLIGGIDSYVGPFIGVLILFLVPEFFRGLKSYSPYIPAVILIIFAFWMRKGLVGLVKAIWSRYFDHRKKPDQGKELSDAA
jgi:branched-chain amino acid transport system permease protein